MQRGIQAETYLYTAGDERIYTGFALTDRTVPRMASEVWTLRDQSAEVLTIYTTNGQRTSGAWQWKEDYVYRGRALLATATAASGLLHISVDHLGTPRATTNAAGVLVSSRHYWGYGQDLGTGGGDPETKRFTGHERDLRLDGTADDLDYMHARYYSPMWGRFLSVDPARSQDPKKPLGWNRYGYALDNPLGYVDPDGRAVETVWDAANVVLGVGSLVANVAAGNLVGAIVDAGALAVDLGATAVPFVPGGASTAVKAARLAHNAKVGRAFEGAVLRAVEFSKNSRTVAVGVGEAARVRIPDGLQGGVLLEAKHVRHLSLDAQMRDFVTVAKERGLTIVLAVTSETKLSKSFLPLIESGQVVVVRFKPQ